MTDRALFVKAIPFFVFSVGLLLLGQCRPSLPLRIYPPSKIERIEGYASLRVRGEQGGGRSKISFLFQVPHQARMAVLDVMGRTLYQIIINEEKAVFALPRQKAYWQGEEEEVVENSLGFRLNLDEMMALISGRWGEREVKSGEEALEQWVFEKDKKGRAVSGQRGEFHFEVREFFAETAFARLVVFDHPSSRGSLKVLGVTFNQSVSRDSFSLSFLDRYQRKDWVEIEKMLRDEN